MRINCPYPGCKKYVYQRMYLELHVIYEHLRPLNSKYFDNDKYNQYEIASNIIKSLTHTP